MVLLWWWADNWGVPKLGKIPTVDLLLGVGLVGLGQVSILPDAACVQSHLLTLQVFSACRHSTLACTMRLGREVYTMVKSLAARSHGAQAFPSMSSVILSMSAQYYQYGVYLPWSRHKDPQRCGLLPRTGQLCMSLLDSLSSFSSKSCYLGDCSTCRVFLSQAGIHSFCVSKFKPSCPDIIQYKGCTRMYKIVRSLDNFMKGRSTDVQLCHF